MKTNTTHTVKSLFIYSVLYAISLALVISVIVLPKYHYDINWLQHVIVFTSFLFLTKYFVYMMVSPWYDITWSLWKINKREKIKQYKPRVSIVVPAWNEEVGILVTIKSLLLSSYENIEIVVINDGSTDNSDFLIKNFVREYVENSNAKQGAKTIVYQYKENSGKGSSLNEGIHLSTGSLIVTIDADCIVHPDAIQNLVAHFADDTVMAAVGNVKVGNVDSFVAAVQQLEFLFSFYLKRADSLFGSIYIIGGAAGAFRKEVFEKLGLYSKNNITEDIELTMRIQKAGMKIVYAADAVVYTEGASDIKGLMKQRLRWKRGRIDTFLKYKNLFFSLRKGHNKFLTFFVLPFAVLGDTELSLEIPFMLFLYFYAYISNDYSPFLALLFIVTFVFVVQLFVPDRKYNKTNIYPLAPIAWLMFYLVTFIEINALVRSLWSLYKKKDILWQKWDRKGLS